MCKPRRGVSTTVVSSWTLVCSRTAAAGGDIIDVKDG
jgi:hypothetical protein